MSVHKRARLFSTGLLAAVLIIALLPTAALAGGPFSFGGYVKDVQTAVQIHTLGDYMTYQSGVIYYAYISRVQARFYRSTLGMRCNVGKTQLFAAEWSPQYPTIKGSQRCSAVMSVPTPAPGSWTGFVGWTPARHNVTRGSLSYLYVKSANVINYNGAFFKQLTTPWFNVSP